MRECWITRWEKYDFPAYLSSKYPTREGARRIEQAHLDIKLDRPLYRIHVKLKEGRA